MNFAKEYSRICFGLFSLLALALVNGCVSQARLSDFKTTANGIDFDAVSQRDYDSKSAVWTEKSGYEYYIEVKKINETDLINGITAAVKELHYTIKTSNPDSGALVARRGIHANEWASVVGIYFRLKGDRYQIYIQNKITQDVTGGWRENRAEKIANAICAKLNGCIDLHAGK
jgi:hypothetical protein